jgi:hypothetical protein
MMNLARLDAGRSSAGKATGDEPVRFCTHCGAIGELGKDDALAGRVCGGCGLGIVLSCSRDALTEDKTAFLVVDAAGAVTAASVAAERLLGAKAHGLDGQALLDLLEPGAATNELCRRVTKAACGERRVSMVPAVLADGGIVNARIGSCGIPRAALLVLLK